MANHPHPFICIFGQKNNGKTTLARFLQGHLNKISSNPLFRLAQFSYPLKFLMGTIFGWNEHYIEEMKNNDRVPEGHTCTVRATLERIGQTIRGIDPNWFEYGALVPTPKAKIFDDGRVMEEAIASKKLGGYNIFIYHPDRINDSKAYTEVWPGHLARVCEDLHQVEAKGEVPPNFLDTINDVIKIPKLFDLICRNDTANLAAFSEETRAAAVQITECYINSH